MPAAGARYVALGSSFGAGPGIPPRAANSPRSAGRSGRNYAHLVASRLGLELDDRTFSGATVREIIGAEAASARAAQLDGVGAATRLVTLTAGGNDVGYLPRLTFASLPAPLRLPRFRARVRELGEPRRTDDAFGSLGDDLRELCRTVRNRSDAVIVLTDYLTIVPGGDVDLGPLPGEIAEWGRGIAARLTETISAAAAAEGALFAAVGELSRAHHAWSEAPWTSRFHLSLRGGAPYHPNAVGMAAVADTITGMLQPHRAALGLG